MWWKKTQEKVMDKSIDVLQKIRSSLLANSTINSLVGGRVLFAVPQQTTYPFLILRVEMTPNDTKTETAGDYLVRIQGFSQDLDQKKLLQTKAEIYNALHRNEVNIDLDGLVQCLQKGINTIMKEPDGKTWMLITDYKLTVEG